MKTDSFIYLIFPNPVTEMTRESPKMTVNLTLCLHWKQNMESEEMPFCVTQLSKLSIITAMHKDTHEGKQHVKTPRQSPF